MPSLFTSEASVPYGGYATSYRGIGRSPCDVAIDPAGNVVMAAADGQLTKIDPATGKFLKSERVTGHAIGIAYDKLGRLWVSDWGDGMVVVLDADWKELFETEVGDHPHDVRIDSHGDAWVIAYSKVTKIGPDGKVLASYPTDPGPLRMKIDAQDNLWIACDGQSGPATRDGDGFTLMKLAPDGRKLWSQKRWVDDLAFDAKGEVWAVTARPAKIAKLDADGKELSSRGAPAEYYVTDYGGRYVEIGPRGQVWIVNNGNLNQLSPAGAFERYYRLGGSAHGLAFDRAGKVWMPFNREEAAGMVVPSQP
jgi:streptogramin lyase